MWDRAPVQTDEPAVPHQSRALAALIGAVMSLALAVILVLGLPVTMLGLVALGQLLTGRPPLGPLADHPGQYFTQLALVLLSTVIYAVGNRALRRIIFTVPPKRSFWAVLLPLLAGVVCAGFPAGLVVFVGQNSWGDPSRSTVMVTVIVALFAVGGAVAVLSIMSRGKLPPTPPRTP